MGQLADLVRLGQQRGLLPQPVKRVPNALIETTEQLDQLGLGAFVRDYEGDIWQRRDHLNPLRTEQWALVWHRKRRYDAYLWERHDVLFDSWSPLYLSDPPPDEEN